MDAEHILVHTAGTIRVVTLNRPARLNAWTPRMMREMTAAIRSANEDDAIEGIVVTGAGRGFCAGADIEEVFAAQAEGDSSVTSGSGSGNWVELVRSSKPIVGAINGPAIGVGLSQVLAFDLLVASRDASFSMRFVKMGVVPELASSKFLVLRCGFGAASELMLTGETISAEQAKQTGLVDHLTEHDELLPTAIDRARAMGENPLAAVRMTKELLTRNATESDLDLIQHRELEALGRAYDTPEHLEAIAAFAEKRAPDFRAARRRAASQAERVEGADPASST